MSRSIALPKWPQMIVVGESVTVDQAREIIRRTDSFFKIGECGNNRERARDIVEQIGIPTACIPSLYDVKWLPEDWDYLDRWRQAWGIISTEFVNNSFVSSAYIGGPHGWCNPDGRIWADDNIGSWPSVENVLSEWKRIAMEFPFLVLTATLMSGEWCEEIVRPLARIRVCAGEACIVDVDSSEPSSGMASRSATIRAKNDLMAERVVSFSLQDSSVPAEWFGMWKEHNKKIMAELAMSLNRGAEQ